MREIISIHLGQAGLQTGQACWELFAQEHGINQAGIMNKSAKNGEGGTSGVSTFFSESDQGNFVPRAIFMDSEPLVADRIRKGDYAKLFNHKQIISGKQDCSNLFPRGQCTIGKELLPRIEEQARKLAEASDLLQGFFLNYSLGGGTGAGVADQLLRKLQMHYPKQLRFGLNIFPSPKLTTSVIEPYNAVLSFPAIQQTLDLSLVLDNQGLYDACAKNLSMPSPDYHNVNQIIAQVMSSMTVCLRFKGDLNVDLHEMLANLVPFQQVNSVLPSFAPLIPPEKENKKQLGVQDIAKAAFDRSCQLVKCNTSKGKYLASSVTFRGDVSPKEVVKAVEYLNQNSEISFAEWVPVGFKVGINTQPLVKVKDSGLGGVKRSVLALSNNTKVRGVFRRIARKFDALYRFRAFVHWYVGDGLEEGFFSESREECAMMIKAYEECESGSG